ncbi:MULTISPECIES: DUF6281 family protein [unclassified Streptomyces]|uniref:DUF6281 family protein n=1 Tax=unclassified Streptomyces TaxID=2593676 RepID=UPI002DD9554A|nr:DUF6281 family protein [Streptomyces sp. NBC_00385]WRZ05596.1 DUF6281 family protein [Streptomyces sp. NBC_00385]
MSWAGRSTGLLLAGLLAMTAAGCGADASSDEGSGSCALEFTYQGRTYRDVANVDFTVSDKLGTAVKPPCDDIGGKDEAGGAGTTETAYKVNGLSPRMAIAVGDSPGDAVLVVSYSGSKIPPEVQKLIDGS